MRLASGSVGTARPGASRSTSHEATAYAARTTAVITNGVCMLLALTSFTVVRALMAVPPIPTPKTPMARPRRSGGNQAFTNGTPTANAVPPMPRKKPPTSRAPSESCPARPRKSTGTMVTADTIGNMTRPPNLSVSAPTGIRPRDPTTTGTATSSDCWNDVRWRVSLNRGPSGLSSAHAQKFSAKPSVAIASISHARPGTVLSDGAAPSFGFNGWTMSRPFRGSSWRCGATGTATTSRRPRVRGPAIPGTHCPVRDTSAAWADRPCGRSQGPSARALPSRDATPAGPWCGPGRPPAGTVTRHGGPGLRP